MQPVTIDPTRPAPLGVAAASDTIESMGGATKSSGDCLTNFFQCLASPFIALWNWLFGCCCAKADPLEQLDPLSLRFHRLYSSFLSETSQPEWKEAIVIYKGYQPIFFQFEKRSRDTIDDLKNETIQKLKSAIEEQALNSFCEVIMIFEEKGSRDNLYSVHRIHSAESVASAGGEIYTSYIKDAAQAQVEDLLKIFNPEQKDVLVEFFFS